MVLHQIKCTNNFDSVSRDESKDEEDDDAGSFKVVDTAEINFNEEEDVCSNVVPRPYSNSFNSISKVNT